MARGKVEASSEKRRQEILTAALDCFTAKGFSETTINDIHERSGASVGSIYHHFESKERLAAALYLEGLKSVHNELRRVVAETDDAEAGIKGFIHVYVAWFQQHPDWGHYLFQGMGAQYLELDGEKIREEVTQLRRDLWGWLKPRIDSGSIADLPMELYNPLLLGPTREFLQQWLVRRTPADLTKSTQALAEAAWRALSAQR